MARHEAKSGSRTTHSFVPENPEELTSEARWQRDQLGQLSERLPFTTGENVLDLGTGPGALLPELARKVGGTGRVVGVDVARKMAEQARARTTDLANCFVVQTGEKFLPFSDSIFAGFLLLFVFHEFAHPEKLLGELARTARSGVAVVLLDWKQSAPGRRGPTLEHRISAESAETMFKESGFRLETRENWSKEIYFRQFERD